MTNEHATGAPFTFPAQRDGGLLLGLNAAQLVILTIGFGIGLVSFQLGVPLPAFAAMGAAGLLAIGEIKGMFLWEIARARIVGISALLTRRHWRSGPPTIGVPTPSRVDHTKLPACLTGVQLHSGHDQLNGVGMIFDPADKTLAAVIRVPGVAFTLLSAEDQMGLLAGWGEVLRGFATEAGPVVRLTWSDWTMPADPSDHLDWVAQQPGGPEAAQASYNHLLSSVRGTATSHDVTVAIAVSAARAGRTTRRRSLIGRLEPVLAQALTELSAALASSGLDPSPPLTTADIAHLVRARTDPFGWQPHRVRSLADQFGLTADGVGPARTQLAMHHFAADTAVHRTYQILELPQTPLRPDWFRPILQTNQGTHRAITTILEPVAPSVSRTKIRRELIRLETDAEVRQEKGLRISAAHRRNITESEAREEQLISGFPEYRVAFLLTVTSPTPSELDDDCASIEALARTYGLLIRPRDGEHDIGWATSLPIGLGLAPQGLL